MSSEERPLISIIMPAFNAERYIKDSVESVLNQTYSNWELIIVNDGSQDGTKAYLDTLKDSRIRVIHQHNKGVSASRNAALDLASGSFLTFLDADDKLPTESLATRANYLMKNPDIDVVDGHILVLNDNLTIEIRRYQPYYHGKLFPRLIRLDDRVFFNVAYMMRVSAVRNCRFREKMTHLEDLAFLMELSCANNSAYGFVNDPVYIYRKSGGSAMNNYEGLETGYIQLISYTRQLPCTSSLDLAILHIKIAKILFLSWFSAGRFYRASLSIFRIGFLPFMRHEE